MGTINSELGPQNQGARNICDRYCCTVRRIGLAVLGLFRMQLIPEVNINMAPAHRKPGWDS